MATDTTVKLSISDLLPFLDCEYKGRTRFETQRWTPPTLQQRLGTHLHALAAAVVTPGAERPTLPNELLTFQHLHLALTNFLTPPPFEVLSVETPLSFELEKGVEIQCRVDGLVNQNGVHDLQYKTLGRGKAVATELERIRMSPHEITYRRAWRRAGVNILGTLVVIIRTYMSQENAKASVPYVQHYTLSATAEEDEEAWKDIEIYLKRLARGKAKAHNWAACQGIYGSCPLLPHCHYRVPVSVCLQSELSNRYADITPDPVAGAPSGT